MAIGTGGIGQALVDEGMLTREQLAAATAQTQKQGGSLGFNLALLGYLQEEEVARFMAMQHGLEYVDLQATQVDPEALKLVSESTAQRLTLLPILKKPNALVCAVVDPSAEGLDQLEKDIKFKTRLSLQFSIAPESYIKLLIEHYYTQLKGMGVVAVDGGAGAPAPSSPAGGEGGDGERVSQSVPKTAQASGPQLDMSAIMERAGEEAELTMLDEKKSDDDLSSEGSPDDSLVIKMCNSMILCLHNAAA